MFGSGVRSYSDAVTRQRRVNVMYDIRKDGDKTAVICIGTPGSYVWATIPAFPIWGARVIGSSAYVVAGTKLYQVSLGGSVTLLGSIPTAARLVSMSDNSVQLIMVDGIFGYVLTLATNTITQITDANFPNGATSVEFLNSVFYVEYPNSRQFAKSAQLDGKTWSPQVYGTKENSSDLTARVCVLNGTLILFGFMTMEYWQDVGASPLPVQRINGVTQQWGLAAINSVSHAKNTLIFLGLNPDGGVSVVMLNGYTPVPISDTDTEAIIASMSLVSDAISYVYHVYGHTVYQITFPTAQRTLCYDLDSQIWHEGQTGVDPTGRHYGNLGFAFANRNVISDATTGNLYFLDQNTNKDNGAAIKREVCTRHARADGNELFLTELLLEFETGVSTGTVGLEISRDGGRTFGPQRTSSLGQVGAYLSRVIFRRMGRARDFVFRITVTDDVRFLISSGSAVIELSES